MSSREHSEASVSIRLPQKTAQKYWVIDWVLSLVMIPCAYVMLVFRKYGGARFPVTHKRLKSIGVYPVRDHYYDPLFNTERLRQPLDQPRHLPGLDLREEAQLTLMRSLDRDREFEDFVTKQAADHSDTAFTMKNRYFEEGDAAFFYQYIRHAKPSRIIEIGGGYSTRVAHGALRMNAGEGTPCEHICIEPYEQPWLEKLDGVTIVRRRLEDLDLDWSRALGPGDILFVDSSHIIRPQGDVLKIYLEILPLLKSGVVVHVHDIFTPRDYLPRWVEVDARFWNEQYLMEALLQNSDRYEVIAALNYQKHTNFGALKRICPYLGADSEPGSFYFRVK